MSIGGIHKEKGVTTCHTCHRLPKINELRVTPLKEVSQQRKAKKDGMTKDQDEKARDAEKKKGTE
jgi:hypothetical protein